MLQRRLPVQPLVWHGQPLGGAGAIVKGVRRIVHQAKELHEAVRLALGQMSFRIAPGKRSLRDVQKRGSFCFRHGEDLSKQIHLINRQPLANGGGGKMGGDLAG